MREAICRRVCAARAHDADLGCIVERTDEIDTLGWILEIVEPVRPLGVARLDTTCVG